MLRDEVANIREVYDGEDEARLVQRRTRDIEFQNVEFWQQYMKIEQREQQIMMRVFDLEQGLDEKIRAIIEKSNVRELELLAGLV